MTATAMNKNQKKELENLKTKNSDYEDEAKRMKREEPKNYNVLMN